MYICCFLLLSYCSVVFCQNCVTDNFENGINHFRVCASGAASSSRLTLLTYSASNMISPHPDSRRFVTPASSLDRCMQLTSPFTVTRGGTLEVNRYTTSKNINDVMRVQVMDTSSSANSPTLVASGSFSPSQSHFNPGWETFRMIVPGTGTFRGIIRFQGRDPGSVLAIDSYRFMSPTQNKDLCNIYNTTITTTTSTTSATTTTVTEEPKKTATTTTQHAPESPTTTSDKSTATTATSTNTTTAAAAMLTAAPSTSTQAPRLSISLQNRVKEFKLNIMNFFK